MLRNGVRDEVPVWSGKMSRGPGRTPTDNSIVVLPPAAPHLVDRLPMMWGHLVIAHLLR